MIYELTKNGETRVIYGSKKRAKQGLNFFKEFCPKDTWKIFNVTASKGENR